MGNFHFIIDEDKEMTCKFGEWFEHDGHIVINLAMMDSPEEFEITVIHEQLHDLIDWAMYPDVTTEKQDHWVIPRMLC